MGFFLTDLIGLPTTVDLYNKEASATKRMSEQQAALDELQARDALARGQEAAGVAKMKGSMLAGAQKAAYAASGVDAGTGTPAAVMSTTDVMADLDSKILMNNAAREAWGYQTKARTTLEQGRMQAAEIAAKGSAQILSTAGEGFSTMASIAGGGYGGGIGKDSTSLGSGLLGSGG